MREDERRRGEGEGRGRGRGGMGEGEDGGVSQAHAEAPSQQHEATPCPPCKPPHPRSVRLAGIPPHAAEQLTAR